MAVSLLVVKDFQRIQAVPEIRAVLGGQLVQWLAVAGV